MLDFKETVWSYIASRIDLLTNVKSDQLKFGMNSLNLENLDIKTENMEIPRTRINNMVIKKLRVELNLTSLAVYVSGVSIDATVESLASTDQMAEQLVNETFNSLSNDKKLGGNGVLASLKSQLSLVVKDVDITLELHGCPNLVNLSIGVIHYKGLKNLEIEDLSGYIVNDDSEVVFINRVLRADNGDTSIDLIRFNPISAINLLFPVINGLLAQPTSPQGHRNTPPRIFIQKLFVLGLSQQLILEGILYDANLSIGCLSFGSILSAEPFLEAELGDTVEATVLSSLDLHLKYADLSCLRGDIESLVDCVSKLVIPEAPEPTKFTVWLPNIRLSLENKMVIHVFVNSITEKCIDVAEIMFTSPNNQLVVKAFVIESADFTVESVQGKFTSELNDQISELQSAIDGTGTDQTTEPSLPRIKLAVRNYLFTFDNRYLKGSILFNTKDTHELRIYSVYKSLGLQFEGEISMKCRSGQWTGDFITKKMLCNLDELLVQTNDSGNSQKSLQIPLWLDFSLNCELRNVSLLIQNKALFMSTHPISISGNSDLRIMLPYVALEIDDIPLLETNKLSVHITSDSVKLITEELALTCCADTFSFLKTINIATSTSDASMPETEALKQVNVLEGIDMDMFSTTPRILAPFSNHKNNVQIINATYSPLFQLEVLFNKISLTFHDGYDFKDVQTTLAHEFKATSNESKVLYNSIMIDKTEPVEVSGVDNSVNEFKRSSSGICIQLNHLSYTNTIYESRTITDFSITEARIIDQISGSVYENVLKSTSNGGKDFTFLMTTKDKESRLSLGIKPLELNLDQYTLEFLLRFFQFESLELVNEPFEELAVSAQQEFFFQRVRINPLKLKVNYTPKKMNYRNLRAGHAQELLNLFAVENATLKLCEIKLYGVNGWVGVFDLAINEWWPDIYKHQLGGLFTSLSPLRLVVRAGLKVTKSSTAKVARTAYRKFIS